MIKNSRFRRLSVALILSIVFLTMGYVRSYMSEIGPAPTGLPAAYKNTGWPQKDIEGQYEGAVITSEDKLICKNNNYSLYFQDKDMIVKVCDLKNGYVWSSSIKEDEGKNLSKSLVSFSKALVTAEVINMKSVKSSQAFSVLSENTDEPVKYIENGIEVDVTFPNTGISLIVKITLEEDGLTVAIPDSGIRQENEQTRLGRLYIMPFFGAAYKDTYPGYIFIPDGSGALIRFDKARVYNSMYKGRIYGRDYSINSVRENTINLRSEFYGAVETPAIMLPVFGIAHGSNQNAFISRITSGAEYCEIHASPAGVVVDYFWAAPQFIYRDIFWQPDNTGYGFSVSQKQDNVVNAQVEYKFLHGDSANYTGMAVKYRKDLEDEGLLPSFKIEKSSAIPLYIDALMAEPVKSLLGTRVEQMTTLAEIENFVYRLERDGVGPLMISLRGIEPGGYSGRRPEAFKLSRAVGGKKELEQLYGLLRTNGGQLMISKDFTEVYDHQTSSNNLLYSIERQYTTKAINAYLFNKKRFISLDVAYKFVSRIADLPAYYQSISLDSAGKLLYTSFKQDHEYTRAQALGKTKALLETAADVTSHLALQAPNEYALAYADSIFDIPLNHSQLMYETDCVPFMQIVLSGRLPLFSQSANAGVDMMNQTLRLIEFGMYPMYTVTGKASNMLSKSNMNTVFNSQFESIAPYLTEQYKTVNEVLSQVTGKSIVSRRVLEEGVAVVGYEEGIQIVVNYTEKAFNYKNMVVNAGSAKIYKGGE